MPRTPKEGEGMTLQQYSDHRRGLGLVGYNIGTIRDALKDGRIKKNKYGWIDAEKADRDWEKNTDFTRYRNDINLSSQFQNNPEVSDIDEDDLPELNISKRRIEAYKAEQEAIKLQETRKEVVRVDDIKASIFNMSRMVRDGLLSIPVRLSPILASMDNPNEIEHMMDKEFEQVLEKLSEEFSVQGEEPVEGNEDDD